MDSLKVVVVEDEVLIRMYSRKQLEALGVEVVGETGHSDEVMDLVVRTRPDLVLMDIRIQGDKTGIELAADFAPRLEIPVAFVTAYELESSELPRGKYFLGVIQKPLAPSGIEEVVKQLEGLRNA